jgi:hypothetical protein
VHEIISLILYVNIKNMGFNCLFCIPTVSWDMSDPPSDIIREDEASCDLEIVSCL